MDRTPITPEGHKRLVDELHHSKTVLRPQVVRDIAEARAHGDISENAEYDAAKDRQGHLEGRIMFLETRIALAEIIDITKIPPADRVVFGCRVQLVNTETDEEVNYRIVGDTEADIKAGRLSYDSPLGRSLMGKRKGDEVKVETPRGTRTFEIVDILYKA